MAIKSTIFKANLQIADIDHGYYADHALTLARHPSETDGRMMVAGRTGPERPPAANLVQRRRHAGLWRRAVGPDDPDASLTDFTGRKRVWIEVGQPEDKPLTKACSKADSVLVYCSTTRLKCGGRALKKADAPGKAPGLAHSYRSIASHGGHGRAQHAAAGHGAGRRADAEQQPGQRAPGTRALEVTEYQPKSLQRPTDKRQQLLNQ